MVRIKQAVLVAGGWLQGAASQETCLFSDGSGACCYKVRTWMAGQSSMHPISEIAHGYSLGGSYKPPLNDNWGWGSDSHGGPLFNYVEAQQFIFSRQVLSEIESGSLIPLLAVNNQECGGDVPAFRMMWQG